MFFSNLSIKLFGVNNVTSFEIVIILLVANFEVNNNCLLCISNKDRKNWILITGKAKLLLKDHKWSKYISVCKIHQKIELVFLIIFCSKFFSFFAKKKRFLHKTPQNIVNKFKFEFLYFLKIDASVKPQLKCYFKTIFTILQNLHSVFFELEKQNKILNVINLYLAGFDNNFFKSINVWMNSGL